MMEERPRVEESPRVVHEDPHLMARLVMVDANVEAFKTMMKWICIVCALHNFVDNEMKLGSNTVAKVGPPTGPDDEALPPLSAPIPVTPLPVPLLIGCDDEPVGGCVDPTPLPLPVTPLPVLLPTGCDDEPIEGCEDPAPLPLPVPTVVTPLLVVPLPIEVVIPLPVEVVIPLPVEVVIPLPFVSLPVAPLPALVLEP
ncbi:hypothetical protein RHSIM_Rhsim05G0109500 [Rhododendron simsii]|uniref:Uncharacterized protein n=1 Tax=Rhododendron simsii TaxID=118357 RepID=A0A834GXD3_RHOSS|nr:hypothetical protein RHSIM_Rhsim05G0109500 [Rhododendron simsii]